MFDSISDDNDKVSGNALRSIGHLGCLVLRSDYQQALTQSQWDNDAFFSKLLSCLSIKVEDVEATIQGHDRSRNLSWKQRSAAKRHGRVACNTLALLFGVLSRRFPDLSDAIVSGCQRAVHALISCVGYLQSPLNDKVIMAATAALRQLSSTLLSSLSGKSGMIGEAMVSCILFLGQVRFRNQSMQKFVHRRRSIH